jgi:lysozyme
MKIPQLALSELYKILEVNKVDRSKPCAVAVRGYYLDTMGKPKVNDRAIFDDAIFIVWPDGVARFQANTDPSKYRAKTSSRKGMAVLKTGIYRFGTGKHKGKLAFRQCEPFTVIRDGNPPYEDTGFHAIDLHEAGDFTTSSEGCQTVPKSTWQSFRTFLYGLLDQYENPIAKNDWGEKVRSFDYLLIDETERRAGNLIVSNRYL